jgi:LmbE family N-acetylglucosaminyl deacetylase
MRDLGRCVKQASDPLDRIMVIVAHPDDAESWAGGTVAQFALDGKTVAYVVITSGEKGSAERTITPEVLREIREGEQRNAAQTLGVREVTFLRYPDCEVEDTQCLRRDVTREIRRFKPERVIVQNPFRTYHHGVSHRDHQVVAGVALDCVYPLAGSCLVFPDLLPEYEPHRAREVYVMQVDNPELVVDISRTIDVKARAFCCRASQIGDTTAAEASIRERAAGFGRSYGMAFAEYFDRLLVPSSSRFP